MKSSQNFDAYFKSAFTVDNVIFGFDEGQLKVLLIRRNEEPDKNSWALPGYFVEREEGLDKAANRVLEEMTGLRQVYLKQLATFGNPGRHPYGRVITVAYYSLVKIADLEPRAAGVAREVGWHPVQDMARLAFDHNKIIGAALRELRESIRVRPVGFELLPPAFTLTQLQHLYEAIWETELEKRNFRKKILAMNLLIDLDRLQENVAHRPARLYAFDEKRYRQLENSGFSFEVKESRNKA